MHTIVTRSQGSNTIVTTNRMEILVDSAADLDSIPAAAAAGSIAYTADLTAMWQKGIDGDWKKIGGED